MSQKSANLHRARAAKNDEFYTQYADVKQECDNYMSHFFNKIIYCNCDTTDSAFVKYFMELKAAGKIRDVWFSGGLGGDDFRSQESIEKLKAADIVVTNPPFSLFREFIDLLVQYNKKFLVIGNMNAISYKIICGLMKNSQIWLGVKSLGGMSFIMPGGDICSIPVAWYTNMKHSSRRSVVMTKHYYGNEMCYPKYDNADAINVNRVTDIPLDYFGVMGVPISFIDKYNPEQFILLGRERDFTPHQQRGKINGRELYARLFIQRKV